MAEMTAKEYLRQLRTLRRDIARKQNQIAQLRAEAERTTSTFEALRTSGTSSHSKLENAVLEMSDIGDELSVAVATYAAKYREISAVIDAVNNPAYRELLSLRYLSDKKWEEIAVEMHYSYVHVVHNLHPAALNAAKELIEFNTAKLI